MPRAFLLSRHLAFWALVCSVVCFVACKDEPLPPPPTQDICPALLALNEGMLKCEVSADEYQPRNDSTQWGAYVCSINEDINQYKPINPSISTMARVEAFEHIAALLWKKPTPSSADFEKAKERYALNEGLDSRVQRREDVHFEALPGAQKCSEAGLAEQCPGRCAGPAHILPVLNDAFAKGMQGQDTSIQARRIEAALLWFFYLSSLAEVQSCAETPNNCDSAWAYYTGGTPRDEPVGLAAYVRALSPETHERAYDAALAVRCWRDLDQAVPANNTTLQSLALGQYDKALIRGIALILNERASKWADPAQHAFVQTLFALMETQATQRNAALAQELKTWVDNPATNSISRIHEIVGFLFPCP